MLDVLVPFDFFCVRRSGEGSLATEKIHVQCLRQKTLDIEDQEFPVARSRKQKRSRMYALSHRFSLADISVRKCGLTSS
jgi:hypothetical protein